MGSGLGAPILLFTDVLHPIDNLTVELFLNGDVRHGGGGGGPMPVLFAGRKPYDITGTDFFDCSAFALGPAAASRDD